MPIFSASQLIGKTFYVTKSLDFYRVNDINNAGDNAKPISNKLKAGYSFVMDSYLAPVQAFKNAYGTQIATRTNTYITFYGSDGGYYAVIYKNDGRFSLKKLQEQGAKSDAEIQAEKEKAVQTPIESISETIKNLFSGAAKTTKTILYIGVGVIALGYLLPKLKK
jgi:hypothetical protein